MRIAEVFHSIQGEGEYTGTPSVFVRTAGCNLRCWFCDTPYTSWAPQGQQSPWEEVLAQVLAFDSPHVVLTGGEPLLQPDAVPLTRALRNAGRFVTVETAGTVYRPVAADLMSISPKLANSTPDALAHPRWSERHDALRSHRDVVCRLLADYPSQLKFVIDAAADLAEVDDYVAGPPPLDPELVWLMPQGRTAAALESRTEWLAPLAAARGYRLSRRLHIELYGNVPGR